MTSVGDRTATATEVPVRRHYKNPPIVETILEITVEMSKRPADNALRSFGTKASGFTFHDDVYEFESHFEFDMTGANPVAQQKKSRLLGYRFAHRADAYILAVTHNGMSLSKLYPYTTWEAVRELASALWLGYMQSFSVKRVISLGLRYINRLDLPLPVTNLSEWIRSGPQIPPTISQEIAGYTLQMGLPQRDLGKTLATVRQAVVAPEKPNVASIVLDIDIRRGVDLPPENTAGLWESIEQIHARENLIFESSITNRTRKLFD